MVTRFASLILILIVVIGGGVLVYRFLRADNNDKIKTLTIDKNGSFKVSEFNVKNDEEFKIKNEDDKNHTVKRKDTGETIVEVDPSSTSKKLSLEDNKKITLYLASDEKKQVTLVTGTPETKTAEKQTEEKKETTTPTDKQTKSQEALGTTTRNNEPLPATGPEEAYIYLILLVLGLRLAKISNRLLSN